jgi:poly(3-hydroxyalkanoate) synthetase
MKKMNYEAPKAEMIEMNMPVVLTESGHISGTTNPPGGDDPLIP